MKTNLIFQTIKHIEVLYGNISNSKSRELSYNLFAVDVSFKSIENYQNNRRQRDYQMAKSGYINYSS